VRRRIVSGEEQDAYTRWRKLLCWTARPGMVKRVKRRTHRRERREGQAEIRAQREDHV
jgi:hypothetical protein